jgi:hypothetical protein
LKIINENFADVMNEDSIFFYPDLFAAADMDADFDAGLQPKVGFYLNFHRYDDVEEIRTRLTNDEPLCGFYSINEPGCVFIAFGKGRKSVDYVKVTYGHSESLPCTGLFYTNMRFDSVREGTTKDDLSSFISGYCLLLPYIERNRQNNNGTQLNGTTNRQSRHCIIRDNWEVINSDHSSELPGYNAVLFQDVLKK